MQYLIRLTLFLACGLLAHSAMGELWTPTPNNVTSVVLWLDAADSSTIHTNAGGLVTRWDDKSGNTNNAAQSDASRQPKYYTGTNAITFARSNNEYLIVPHTDELNINDGKSVFAVYKWVTTTTWSVLMGKDNWNASAGWLLYQGNASGAGFEAAGYDGGVGQPSTSGETLIFEGFGTSTNCWSYKNGSNYNANTWSMADTTTQLNVGARNNNGGGGYKDPWNGDINEIIIIDDVVDTATREKIEGYLAWKWGLEGNLPGGHPYKSSPPLIIPAGTVIIIK